MEEPTPVRVQAYIALCFTHLTAGDLLQLQLEARHMHGLGERATYPLAMTWADYFLGLTHYEWNELDEATLSFEAVYRSRYLASSLSVHMALIGLVKTHLACDRLEQAQATLAKLQAYTIESGSADPPPDVDTLQSLILFRQGNTRMVNRWAQTTYSAPRPTPLFFYEDSELMQLTVQLNQQERADWRAIIDQLQKLLQEARAGHGSLRTIQILAHLALAYGKQERLDTALAHLEQAITLAQPGGFIRTFIDLGLEMSDLLKQFVGKASMDLADDSVPSEANVEYAVRILDAFPKTQPESDPSSMVWQQAQTTMIDPLTQRESQVLVLLAQELSYQEIANQLIVTLNTVKKHTSHIYQKLGVNNRRAAIEKARTQRILPPA
jgi:LuxR family maltose regulon positive regulatory protein